MAHLLFTARAGGTSTGSYKSLNVANHVGDLEYIVENNREILRRLSSTNSLQFMEQVHGNGLVVINEAKSQAPQADALVTRVKSLGLVVMVADCLPVLIDGGEIIGAVHVGRKGMVNGIIAKTIASMKELGASNLKATIGPGICGACYEVDESMYKEIIASFPDADSGYRKLDIRRSITTQLEKLEVEVINIAECTLENSKYFSFRGDKLAGRQCGVISL